MLRRLLQLLNNRRGQDLIEYALLCALVATGTAILLPRTIVGNMTHIYSRVSSLLIRFGGGGG
jgi:Flp pilus assembly pilin Flp